MPEALKPATQIGEEVERRQMTPAMTLQEVVAKHGKVFNITQHYSIEQTT